MGITQLLRGQLLLQNQIPEGLRAGDSHDHRPHVEGKASQEAGGAGANERMLDKRLKVIHLQERNRIHSSREDRGEIIT